MVDFFWFLNSISFFKWKKMLIQFSSLLYVDHSDESPGNSQALLKSLFFFPEVYVIHDGYTVSVFAVNPLQGAPTTSLFNRRGHVHLWLLIAPVVAVDLYLPSLLSVFIQSVPKPIKKRQFSLLLSYLILLSHSNSLVPTWQRQFIQES